MQDCSIPIANALEILQSCTKPLRNQGKIEVYDDHPMLQDIVAADDLVQIGTRTLAASVMFYILENIFHWHHKS